MKKYWGMFQYVAENLKDLYRQHADAQSKGPVASADGKSKSSIFQYGDWFDRYPHGVSKTDYEDAAEPTINEPGTDAVLGEKSDLQSVEDFFASLSPPSKAAQRKQARKMKAKSVSKVAVAETPKPQRQNSIKAPPSTSSRAQQQQPVSHIAIKNDTTMATSPTNAFDPPAYFSQNQSTSQQFISEFAGPHSLLNTGTSPSLAHLPHLQNPHIHPRSEERRVGKECRSRWSM